MLRPALARGNIHVQTDAQVARVMVEKGRATGVAADRRALDQGAPRGDPFGRHGADAADPDALGHRPGRAPQDMGIEVVLDLPGVGENYHDHPASPMHMETDDPTSYGLSWKVLPRDVWHLVQYLLTRTGPLAGNVFESVAFLRTDPSLEQADVQFVFQPARRLTNPGSRSRSATATRSARSRSIPRAAAPCASPAHDPAPRR
jgi:choline dehydrogenase-like flavoprotein